MARRSARTDAARVRAYHRILDARERRLTDRLAAEIGRAVRAAAEAYPSWRDALDGHAQRLATILREEARRTMRAGAEHVRGAAKSAHPDIEHKAALIGDDDGDLLDRALRAYAAASSRRVQAIANTTRERIRTAISDGVEDGLGAEEIARMIRDQTGSMTLSRARTIARTETAGVLNAGQQVEAQAIAEETGSKYVKIWLSTNDPRTRETHTAANNQKVGMDDPFKVGNAELMYPGDQSGPPEEVINCRCAVAYELDRGR